MAKRLLPKLAEGDARLGLPTIMDRALAAEHGTPYVHLAAFAIDVDRVYWLDPERDDLPFGWEVFLTECYLLAHFDASTPQARDLIERLINGLMEESPGEPPLGGQLVFAVFDALARGVLPNELTASFRGWRAAPLDLVDSLAQLFGDAQSALRDLAEYCLDAELTPALSPPTRAALELMRRGELVLPRADTTTDPSDTKTDTTPDTTT
jgi:hypothetical protein